MNEPYRLRYTNQAVGFFLLVVLLFLIVLSVLVLRAGDYFVRRDRYWIEISQEEIGDLYKGAEVMILGERAGQIESIRYVDDSDKVRVNLIIEPEMSDQIFKDSVVRQERKFGLGSPILVIRRSGPKEAERQPLPTGSLLQNYQGENDRLDQMTREVESVSLAIRLIQEQLEPTLTSITAATDKLRLTLDDSADPALKETKQAASSFYETNETVRPKTLETLDAIRSATANLETKIVGLTDDVSAVVRDDVRDTLADVRESTESVRTTADAIAQTSQDVNRDIAESLVTLRDAAVEVQKLAVQTQDLVRVIRGEADQFPGTTERVNETITDTQNMVGEIRSHWLLRRYSTQGQPSSQISPSGVRGSGVRP